MRLRIFVPAEPSQRLRCLELIQRANQLNLSTRRYEEAEFKRLMETPGMLPFRVSEERDGHTVMDWTLDENIAVSNISTLESEVDLAEAGIHQRPGR
jgi:hypothetical protein